MGTRACSKAEHRNSEGKWKDLTSFVKNKEIQIEGRVQGGKALNLKSIMLASNKDEPKEQISMRNWPDPQKSKKDRKEEEGRKKGRRRSLTVNDSL